MDTHAYEVFMQYINSFLLCLCVRIYVNFFDMEAANVAWNNSTFG